MNTQRVWAIFYRIRTCSQSKWGSWTGPCGVYALNYTQKFPLHGKITDALSGRPFFFRTRKQARTMAKKLDKLDNTIWTWAQHTVRPIKLTYEEI